MVSVWEEGASLTPYPPFASRGELLAFEQSRHQLPPTHPRDASLGHLSCVPLHRHPPP